MVDEARADLLLVTVTAVETGAVLDAFGVPRQDAKPQSINGRIYFDLGAINGARVMLTESEMGASSLGASAQAVGASIAALSPAAVVMVGIAFGVDDQTQKIGDVLVAKRLHLYEPQRVGSAIDANATIPRGDKAHASPWLLNHFKSSATSWEGATLRFGTVLTGEKLVDNAGFRDQLRALEPDAIGGEMEGTGLYAACHAQKIDWLLVKGICDFADGQKDHNKAERQALAARNAAQFVHHAVLFAAIDWEAHHRQAERPKARSKSGPARRVRVAITIVALLVSGLGFAMARGRAKRPTAAVGYARVGFTTIADDCVKPSVLLTTTYLSNGSSYPWPITRQAFRANRQFKIVDTEPAHAYEVRLAPYQYDDNAYALVATCYDGSTCNDVAAMYKAIVRSSTPQPFCGASAHLGAAPVGAFDWNPDANRNLPEANDTRALCARINACQLATDRSIEGDPLLECQKEPERFKTSCALLDPCDKVLECLSSFDAMWRSWGCAR